MIIMMNWKSTELENARPWQHTWIPVLKILVYRRLELRRCLEETIILGWITNSTLIQKAPLQKRKRCKYLDLARELKELWNIKVTVIPMIIGAPETVPKNLVRGMEELEIGGCAETTNTTASLRSAGNIEKSPRNLRRLAVTQTLIKKKNISKRWCDKNLQGVIQ